MPHAQEILRAMGEYMDGEGQFELGCSTNALLPRGLCGWGRPRGFMSWGDHVDGDIPWMPSAQECPQFCGRVVDGDSGVFIVPCVLVGVVWIGGGACPQHAQPLGVPQGRVY